MEKFFSMMESCEFWIGTCVSLFIVAVATAVIACNVSSDIRNVQLAKAGYEQVVAPGSSFPIWQKAK